MRDFERKVSKKGKKDANTMGSYLALRAINPDVILSSCALRAQETTDLLASKISFSGEIHYLQELYLTSLEEILDIVKIQDSDVESMFLVGHNPQLHELANFLTDEYIHKFPSLGIISIVFEIEEWSEIESVLGTLNFFIFPKQFKYYMPRDVRSYLPLGKAQG